MTDIQRHLFLYGDLSPAEQVEVERYVEAHPEWASTLDEVRALYATLESIHDTHARPDTLDLADYVVARALAAPLTAEEQTRYARVEEALSEDGALASHVRELQQTLDHIAETSEPPVAQFERLAGRRLADTPRSVESGDPARIMAWHPVRFAVAACFAVAVAYAALALASNALQPERSALADLGTLPEAYEGLRLRGDAPADRTSDRYAFALDALAEARSNTLGLFPRYDDAALDDVASQLRAIADASETPESWEAMEALYVLGKIRFHQGQDEEALWALQSVVALGGPHAAEARRLLDYLQQ